MCGSIPVLSFMEPGRSHRSNPLPSTVLSPAVPATPTGVQDAALATSVFLMSWAPLIDPVLVRYIATFLTSAIKSTDRTRANPIHG